MDNFVGEIRIFGGTYAPVNWHFCDGSLLSVSTYPALFSLIGAQYGGDGTTTFALPDLRGTLAVSTGQGADLSGNYPFAQRGGVGTVALTEATMPTHTHTQVASTAAATTTTPTNALYGTLADPAIGYVSTLAVPAPPILAADPAMASYEGGNQPHRNDMPTFGLSYIIALIGNYPTFN